MTSEPDASVVFSALGLPEPLLKATDELGFSHCTEIQALTLPAIIAGHDVAAQAQTGTGKTAAFLLGSFTRLLQDDGGDRGKDQPRMLVIAPTRELAIQIKKDADGLSKHTALKCAVAYGGIDYEKQRKELAAGVDVLIGTPGRLIDYFKQKVFNLRKLEIVVLDEADRMFDLGFIADIRFLLRRMPEPPDRLSMLFSATLSHRVMELAYEHMDHPEELKTETTGVTADGVQQSLYQPASDEKISLLVGLLRQLEPQRSIIFVNTKRTAERVESYLLGNGFQCGTLSGDVRQNRRQKILSEFTSGALPILIATDVAARGLHIDNVSHVFNYDLPQQAEDYVHRIGRTARAGSQGVAVSFACETYSFSLPDIQDFIGQSIPLEAITDELLVKLERPKYVERDRVVPHGKRGKDSRGGRAGSSRSGGGRSGGGRPGGRGAGDQRRSGSGDSNRSRPANSQQNTAKPAAEGAPTDKTAVSTDSSADGVKKKRRRRRRRKPSDSPDTKPDTKPDTNAGAQNQTTDKQRE
ncbi:MAG: DEAD/DEAH box helicase [Granulosicoccus sp.]